MLLAMGWPSTTAMSIAMSRKLSTFIAMNSEKTTRR
jgi:hypothetical protein